MAEKYRGTILKLLLLLFLIPLIQYVDSRSIVKFLPGFDGPLPFELETGYIGVGETEELQLFYYFIKSESNPEEDPLLIWLSGGPGCSSLTGLLFENGPIAFKGDSYNGDVPSLVSTTYSWTKVANIIYLDQPVGTGFSYSMAPFIETVTDTREVKLVAEFVRNWLAKHPEFFSNPFYVAGDSFAGKVVPAIVQEISNGNYICCKPQINLQGYVLGNPVTDEVAAHNFRIQFSHGMSLISDELYEGLMRSCGGNYIRVDPLNTECVKLVAEFEKCVEKLYIEHILLPNCDETSPNCHVYPHALSAYWANDDRVRRALHVKKGSKGEWLRCLHDKLPYREDIKNSFPYHKNNSVKGYRSLIYSGDHDLKVPPMDTQTWIKALNYSIVDDWRPWMIDDQVGGYTRTYANKMTFATVKGGGHTGEVEPVPTSIMVRRWLSGKPL